MKKLIILLLLLLTGFLAGCNAVVNLNGKVMGVNSGQFIYQDGNLIINYKADIYRVWKACDLTVKELKGTDIWKKSKIATGIINAVVHDEKVKISIEYVDQNTTSVTVFVGVAGNNMASTLIHEKNSPLFG